MNEAGKKIESEYHFVNPSLALLPSQVSHLALSTEENELNLSRVPFHTLSTSVLFSLPIFPVTAPQSSSKQSRFLLKWTFSVFDHPKTLVLPKWLN